MFKWFKKNKETNQMRIILRGGEKKMVKLRVHGIAEKDEPILDVKLLKDDKGLVVAVVDKDGKPIANGTIVRLTNEGTLVRLPALSDKLGLQYNKKKQILEITKV